MKKKAFLIGIYSLFLYSLFATTYNSNAIGQKLGEYYPLSEYYLIEEVSKSKTIKKLYKNDKLIETKEIEEKENIKTISIESNDNTSFKTFKNDKIISEKIDDITIIYSYDNNLISNKTISKDKKILSLKKYIYDNENKLSMIIEIKNNKIQTKYFSFSLNLLSIILYNNKSNNYIESRINKSIINSIEYDNDTLLNNIEVEEQNENEIILVKNDNKSKEKEYYKDGLLFKKETYLDDLLIKSIEYEYDENYLLKKEIISEKILNVYTKQYFKENKIINFYKDSKLEKTQTFENGIIVSEFTYNDNIKIENIYQNGKPYCTITLDNDKIIDIQYREVADDL